MILAFAGRRIDAAGTSSPRFPLANVALVRTRIRAVLEDRATKAVVSSAACGSDLITLAEVKALGLRRKIVLPFSRIKFRDTSVTDRPGDWGPVYDGILNDAEASGDLIVLDEPLGDQAYLVVNETILDAAVAWMKTLHQPGCAVLVWDKKSRGDHDITENFGIEARKRGMTVIEVPTL